MIENISAYYYTNINFLLFRIYHIVDEYNFIRKIIVGAFNIYGNNDIIIVQPMNQINEEEVHNTKAFSSSDSIITTTTLDRLSGKMTYNFNLNKFGFVCTQTVVYFWNEFPIDLVFHENEFWKGPMPITAYLYQEDKGFTALFEQTFSPIRIDKREEEYFGNASNNRSQDDNQTEYLSIVNNSIKKSKKSKKRRKRDKKNCSNNKKTLNIVEIYF